MPDSPFAARSLWLARWVGVAAVACAAARVGQLIPMGPSTAYLGAAAYGIPLAAGLVLGRWGWTAVLVAGLLSAREVTAHGWVGVTAATLTAAYAGYRCRRGWPFEPALGWQADVGRLARLAAETAIVRGVTTGMLAASVGIPGAARDGVTASFLALPAAVIWGAVAGGLWARSARPFLAVVPLAVAAGLVVASRYTDTRRPLVHEPAAVWWLGCGALAAVSLGLLALAAVTRERLADAALRNRLLADLKSVSADLLRRRAAMEALLDQLPVGVLFLDHEGQVLRQNRKYRDGLRLPTDFPELHPGHPSASGRWQVTRADGTEIPSADWSVYRAAREGKTVADREARVLSADGTWRDVSVSSAPVTDPDSGSPGSVFVVSDLTARKQAERDRQAAEDRLRGALDCANMYAWEWDTEADAIDMFGQFREVLGLPPDAPPLRSLAEFTALLHPADRAARQRLNADLMAIRRTAYEIEFRVVRADGGTAWLSSRGQAVTGADGQPTGRFAGVTMDVTARKLAEERATEAESHARFALAAARMSAWDWELATGRVTRSEPLHGWLGLPPEYPMDQSGSLVPLLHPDDKQRYEREVLPVILTGREFEWDFRLRHADGSWRWMRSRGRGVAGPDGRVARIAGVHIDVSAEKESEERLRLLESAVVHARDAVVILDAEPNEAGGRAVRYANAAFERITGYTPAEVAGRSLSMLGGPGTDPGVLGRLRAALDAGQPLLAELLNYHKAGGEVWVELSLVPVPDGAGAFSHFVMIQRDITDRKRAEARVRESEERLRVIGDSLPDGAVFQFVLDPTGRPHIPYISAGIERLVGVSPADIMADATALMGRLVEADRDMFAARKAQSATDLSTCEMEFRFTGRDGREVTCYARSQPLRLPGGGVLWNGVLLDVTDRKRAERAVRESEERLRVIGDSLPGGYVYQFKVAADGTASMPYVSAGVEAMTGFSPSELMADCSPVLTRMHADDTDRFAAAVSASAADLSQFEGEYRHHTRDGRLVTCYARSQPARLPDGGTIWSGVLLDVTDQRQTQEDLRRSEERFRGMFENAAAGVSETGPDGRFTAVNPAFAALLGRPAADIIGRSPGDFTHPDDWANQRTLLAEVGAGTRDEYRVAKRYLRPDGSVVWTELSAAVHRDATGRVRSVLGVSVDVSERRRLEEQLLQVQKMEAVGQLAGGIAHDFNNLLTGVIGHLGLVELPPADPNRTHLQTAERAANRAAELTQKLLGFARKNQLMLVPVPASACVAEVLDLVRPNLGKSIALVSDIAATDAVLADPALIGQVVLNLCLNARDAMPRGGTLSVGTAAVTVSPAEAAAHPHGLPGPHVRIRVADTGTGIPPEVMARVFEPFFTTKGVGKGTGLGLAMVDGIVRQHGGWVAVDSTVGVGTRFDIYLKPAEEPAGTRSGVLKRALAERVSPALTDTPPPRLRPPTPGTVLLVDDEEMIRLLGRNVLEDAGFTVLEAEDGADALNLFRDRHADIDLVVMDLTMPRMGGREAFRHMADIRPSARVLLSSGYTAEDLSDMAGAVGLLAKPYRPAELIAAVRQALGGGPVS